MSLLYLSSLLISISGLMIIDWRHKLAFWFDFKRTTLTISIAGLVFIAWDFLGIFLDIFYHGQSKYSLPFVILPEFPLEEIFFIFLLCYCTLIIYRGIDKWLNT